MAATPPNQTGFQNITPTDLSDPTLGKLNRSFLGLWSKIGGLFGRGNVVLSSDAVFNTVKVAGQTSPPTNGDELLTLASADALFGPVAMRQALVFGTGKTPAAGVRQPLQPLPYILKGSISTVVFGGTRKQRQDIGANPQNDPKKLQLWSIYEETDTGLVYNVRLDPTTNQNDWFYLTGIWLLKFLFRNNPYTLGGFGARDWDYRDKNVELLLSDNDPTSENGQMFYTVQLNGATWDAYYQNGVYYNTAGATPSGPIGAGLVDTDIGLLVFMSTVGHEWSYQGSGIWTWSSGEGAGQIVLGPVAPQPGSGWWQLLPPGGGTYDISTSSGAPVSIPYPAIAGLPVGYNPYIRL